MNRIAGIRIRTWSGGSFAANGTTGTVSVTTGNDTLEGIAAGINDAGMGVTASVVQKSDSNYALVIRPAPASTMPCVFR